MATPPGAVGRAGEARPGRGFCHAPASPARPQLPKYLGFFTTELRNSPSLMRLLDELVVPE